MCVCMCVMIGLYCIVHELFQKVGLSVICMGHIMEILYPEAQTLVDNSVLHAHEP